ncbi:lipase 3-like [Onthophagus taurus]|uniref:lipase 3-like n=1 Tax=Onthophagus taurus TaxID=166361 RepID=UPI000C206AA0|nr:lipase 3-like [Onthophagus taurus]
MASTSWIVFGLICLQGTLGGLTRSSRLHPDWGLNVVEMLERQGYPVEVHHVTTPDGYILGMQRVPYSPGINEDVQNKPVVLLMHGLGSSAADFVNMGPGRSLTYHLAERGYDVWLGNARGTTWSRNHTTLDPELQDFWLFSWNEIGTIDLPAMIDYITETTQQEKIFYIGHSQGTTSFFVMGAEKPEYNDKIRLMAALAPAAYIPNLLSPLYRILSPYWEDLLPYFDEYSIWELGPHSSLIDTIGKTFCDEGIPYQEICSNLMFIFTGFSYDQMDANMIPVMMSNAPAGASIRQYVHYAQSIKEGFFRKYDFGMVQNLNIYGQATPPDYDLGKVSAPVAFFYSANDWLVHLTDAARTKSELGNVVLDHLVEHKTFSHIDFLFGKNATEYVYNYLFDVFEQY